MKFNVVIKILVLLLIIQSCFNPKTNKEKIWSMIKSNNIDSIIDATMVIQNKKDTSMIDALLYKADDPRITHRSFQKGMSVYQIKMTALKQITNLTPPQRITYNVDTLIINFYKRSLNYKTP